MLMTLASPTSTITKARIMGVSHMIHLRLGHGQLKDGAQQFLRY
uniref:Uncharacterized protein n=1 Tax=Medicago truncatula TaxID=3880 RepID=I3T1F3_MEDTR|nr:unknown [Medicago truncatula]